MRRKEIRASLQSEESRRDISARNRSVLFVRARATEVSQQMGHIRKLSLFCLSFLPHSVVGRVQVGYD
jgi:hypothetical protein